MGKVIKDGFLDIEPSLMQTKWCVVCFLHDNEKVPAEFVLHGNSMCENHMPKERHDPV